MNTPFNFLLPNLKVTHATHPLIIFVWYLLKDSTQVESETRPVEITSEQGNKSLATVCPTNMM